MTDLPLSLPTRPRGSSVRAARKALVALARSTLAPRLGVRLSRGVGVALALWFAAGALVAARDLDGDGWTAGFAARGAAFITAYAGGLATLSLASSAKSRELSEGAAGLARIRGFSSRAFAFAEMAASIRIVGETVATPTAALALACVLLSRDSSMPALLPSVGATAFAAFASIILGGLASACRFWGGSRARSWLLAAVVIPFVVGEALLSGRGGELVSIPGLLTYAWRLLVGVSA